MEQEQLLVGLLMLLHLHHFAHHRLAWGVKVQGFLIF